MAAKEKLPHVEYQIIDPNLPAGPNTGYLYMSKPHPKDNYIANSVRRTIDTGIIISVPDGLRVLVRGIYGNEAKGLDIVPLELTGPLPPQPLHVVLANNASATVKLDPQVPIAQVYALKVDPPVLWKEHVPQSEQERQQELMGKREPDAA
jgi:hypothetical protein